MTISRCKRRVLTAGTFSNLNIVCRGEGGRIPPIPEVPGVPVVPGITPVVPGMTPVVPGMTPVVPGITPLLEPIVPEPQDSR